MQSGVLSSPSAIVMDQPHYTLVKQMRGKQISRVVENTTLNRLVGCHGHGSPRTMWAQGLLAMKALCNPAPNATSLNENNTCRIRMYFKLQFPISDLSRSTVATSRRLQIIRAMDKDHELRSLLLRSICSGAFRHEPETSNVRC